MSDQCESGGARGGGRIGRRTLLSGLGASGLAVAVGLFGHSTEAHAADWMCCNLAFPNNNNWNACSSRSPDYIWSCAAEGSLICECCEKYSEGLSGGTCSY